MELKDELGASSKLIPLDTRIRSMELKDMSAYSLMNIYDFKNPFNGIERTYFLAKTSSLLAQSESVQWN